MTDGINNERKHELCKILTSNLPTLRTKAKLTQDELSDRLGFSRQTISAIESKKRDMQWSTFTAITLFLSTNKDVSQLMAVMGILDDDVREMLNIEPKSNQV